MIHINNKWKTGGGIGRLHHHGSGRGRAGIKVPSLCHMKNVHQYGSCRICVVEVEGHEEPAGVLHGKGQGGHGGENPFPQGAGGQEGTL